jgi:hypothetical protein
MTRWLEAAHAASEAGTKPTEPTKPARGLCRDTGDTTERGVLSVSSVLSEGGGTAARPPAAGFAEIGASPPSGGHGGAVHRCAVCGSTDAPWGFRAPGPWRDLPPERRRYTFACAAHRAEVEARWQADPFGRPQPLTGGGR